MTRWLARAPLLALLLAGAARASMFEAIGVNARDAAMAGAVTADDFDYSALYYNPAMIVLKPHVEIAFTGVMSKTFASVQSKDSSRSLDCKYCTPPLLSGFNVGLLFPFAGKLHNRVAIGATLGKPSFRLVHVKAEDPSRPFWYRYQTEDRFVSFLGLGVKVADGFAIGVGVQILADLVGDGASVSVDLFNKKFEEREIDSYLANTLSPTAGIYWELDPTFRLGLSYRGERSLYYEVPASVTLSGIGELDFKISGYNHYTPHTFTLGASWSPTPEMSLNADFEYALWNRAPTPYVNVDIAVSGDVIKALGLEDALKQFTSQAPPGFSNTLSARLGFEYRFDQDLALRAGAYFSPTPVPRQDVPDTNVLDANTIGATAGFGFTFKDPLEVFENPIHVDLALQVAYLLPRSANKESTDDVPPYDYSAVNAAGAFDLRYTF